MINDIVNHIKARIGTYKRDIELDDDAIIRCLEQETLKTLSVYFPYYVEWTLDTTLEKVPGMSNVFYLPELIADRFYVFGVEKVIPAITQSGMSQLTNIYGSNLPSLSNYVDTKLNSTFNSLLSMPDTFTYLPPNMVRLNNINALVGYNAMKCILKVTHSRDFKTFPFGLRETIKKLALYDVCLDIKGIRQYFSTVNTTFGEIQLNMDLFDVSDKRDDLIETLRKNQLKNSQVKKIYIA
jgi:hypothetical protein